MTPAVRARNYPYNGDMKSPRLTRRALAGCIAAPLLLGAKADAQAPAPAPAPSSAPSRSRFQDGSRELAAVKLPRNIEPATRFEA